MAFNTHCDKYFPVTKDKLVWTHIANQGRSAGQGSKLKKMGLNAGWFDFIFEHNRVTHVYNIHLEAKVVDDKTGLKRDYSHSQKTFHYLTENFPIFKAKFYSVEEGHNLLMKAGLTPLMPCTLFMEPDFLTLKDKFALAHALYAPPKSPSSNPHSSASPTEDASTAKDISF